MLKTGKGRAAMLAAASVIAASAALSPAGASDFDPAARPTIEAVAAPVAHAADHADEAAPAQKIGAKKWALLAAAAAALGGLVKLIGARKVADMVTESAVKTARATAAGASAVVKTVTRAVGAPFRFLALLFGLALFALTGAGLYDVEWITGLLSGAALVGAALFGLAKTRRALVPARLKGKPKTITVDRN